MLSKIVHYILVFVLLIEVGSYRFYQLIIWIWTHENLLSQVVETIYFVDIFGLSAFRGLFSHHIFKRFMLLMLLLVLLLFKSLFFFFLCPFSFYFIHDLNYGK